jgi:hypothetical protein
MNATAWQGWESGGCSAMVQFAFGRYAGVVGVTFRFNRPGSAGVWIWNRGQDLWALSVSALIVLKLTGAIAWSWWWVLSPLWISGILLAPVLCALLVLLGQAWSIQRRLAAERYGAELREGFRANATFPGYRDTCMDNAPFLRTA